MDKTIAPKPRLPLSVLKAVGKIEQDTREILDPIQKSIAHLDPLLAQYMIDLPHVTEVLRTSANESFVAKAEFYESQADFRFEWLDEVVDETVSATLNLANSLMMYRSFRKAPIPEQLRAEVQAALKRRAPEHEESAGSIDSVKAERRRLRNDYKDECKRAAMRVTDEMIAKAANPARPNSKGWNTRDPITKWLQGDAKYGGKYDRLIRKVFRDKPHLPKPQPTKHQQ